MVKSYTIPFLDRAMRHGPRTAIVDASGATSFDDLADAARHTAPVLCAGSGDLRGERVAFLVSPGATWVRVLWGIWLAGGVAVPLSPLHPRPELEHVIGDSAAAILVADAAHAELIQTIAVEQGRRTVAAEMQAATPQTLTPLDEGRDAMILYTSGTTGQPKGVVSTHRSLRAQVECLVAAWEWSAADHILHVLPLHHVHGIVNALCCASWSGAICEMLPRFDPGLVWGRFAQGQVTLFMAVPTIYSRLITAWEAAPIETQRAWSHACRGMRLMVSGSAALPVPVLERWREITGHTLLERYGMTEFGMALSNPLHGERRPGHVGSPLPGVEVQLTGDDGHPPTDGEPGEIEVRGPGVFAKYWRQPEATRLAFRRGWFRTGDIALLEGGSYRILGRASTDILKTGGYKVSALEIEAVLLAHPGVAECAVVGVPDDQWGERVAAAVVLRPGQTLKLDRLRDWAKELLAPYKIPTLLRCLEELPRNALGKVLKPEVVKWFG